MRPFADMTTSQAFSWILCHILTCLHRCIACCMTAFKFRLRIEADSSIAMSILLHCVTVSTHRSGSVTAEKCCFSKVKNLFEYQQCQLVASYCCDIVEGRSRNDIRTSRIYIGACDRDEILQLLESSDSMPVRCQSEWRVPCSTDGGIVDVPTSHCCC